MTAFGHLNYFRWGTVYLTDMKMLQEVAPTVHWEFTENRAHAVSASSSESSFNSVSPDMALEQTVNRDSKTKRGIVGGTSMERTRDSWALTAQVMAAATVSFKVVSGTSTGSSFHKELGSQRIERDENDVNNSFTALKRNRQIHSISVSTREKRCRPLIIVFFFPDTDVAVLCWYHFSQLSIQELWLHTGTGRNRRFIPVHKAVEKVGQDVCNLLPVMHALTGCDSTSNLNGIGKKGGFTTLKKHKDDVVELKNLEMGGPRMRWEILFQNSSHRGSELAGLLSSPVFPCLPAY